MAVAGAKGKQPKLTGWQQAHLVESHATGEHSIADPPSCSLCRERRCTVFWSGPDRPATCIVDV